MTIRTAILLVRVSSREQDEEGYSLSAQERSLREYADKHGFKIIRVFSLIESASKAARKQFQEAVAFLKHNKSCQILIVEKTDRLYRNPKDPVTIQDLDIETHFVKEGVILSKHSKSHDVLMHDIRVALARNYSKNLSEEVIKGMTEKAEQGIYPGNPPFGYIHDKIHRTIAIHSVKSNYAKRAYELFATGQYSVPTLRKLLVQETGIKVSKSNLHRILTNTFYIGKFPWRGKIYDGKHPLFIEHSLFLRVQAILKGNNPPRATYGEVDIPFRGLVECGICGCDITGSRKKEIYVYYHCTHGRGPCLLPRFTDQKVASLFGAAVSHLHIPRDVAHTIKVSVQAVHDEILGKAQQERTAATEDLAEIQKRQLVAYNEKSAGTIPMELWKAIQDDLIRQEIEVRARLEEMADPKISDRMLELTRTLELCQTIDSQYLCGNMHEKADLLKKVLSNSKIDGVSLCVSWRKPFDFIGKWAKNEIWSGREDLNLRPPGPEPVFRDC